MELGPRKIAAAAAIAAVYFTLTFYLAPISYGPIQFRIAEVLCILPFFFPASVAGLMFGCALANLFGEFGFIDAAVGSLATTLAGMATFFIGYRARKNGEPSGWACFWGCMMPVVFNGPIIGAMLAYLLTPDEFWTSFLIFGAQVSLGQAVVMLAIGLPLLRWMLRQSRIITFFEGLR